MAVQRKTFSNSITKTNTRTTHTHCFNSRLQVNLGCPLPLSFPFQSVQNLYILSSCTSSFNTNILWILRFFLFNVNHTSVWSYSFQLYLTSMSCSQFISSFHCNISELIVWQFYKVIHRIYFTTHSMHFHAVGWKNCAPVMCSTMHFHSEFTNPDPALP